MSKQLEQTNATATALEALRNLSDPDPAVRLQAARWLTKKALGETSIEVAAWLANAQAVSPIIAALDDPDPRVAEEAVITIAETSRRYYKDVRAYPGVIRLLKSNRRHTRMWAVDAARWLRGKRCLKDILPLLDDRSRNVRREVLRVIIGTADGKLGSRLRERLLAAVRPILRDEDAPLRGSAANVLREIGDSSHLDELKKALKQERDRLTRECMETAIESIEKKAHGAPTSY
jgi:HEAT repeat protein